MRFLPTLLLTTTFFTTNLFASEAIESTSAAAPSTSTTATTIAPNVQAQIYALNTLFSSTTTFNVSDAIEIFFSPDLYPFISWRSTTKDAAVVAKVRKTMGDAIEKKFNRNSDVCANALFAILFPDDLEIHPFNDGFPLKGVINPTDLNKLIECTVFRRYFDNVVEHFHLTFSPAVRLKLYLELLHQTNITPDSLGHVLRVTTELATVFMTAPIEVCVQAVSSSKNDLLNRISSESMSHLYYQFEYLSLKGIHSKTLTQAQTLRYLDTIDSELSHKLTGMDSEIDRSFSSTNETIDRILTSFGSEALPLFQEIFHLIATHPKTKPSDKTTAAEQLGYAGGSFDLITNAQFAIATDHNIDINARLNAASIFQKTCGEPAKAIAAYTQIAETVNSTTNQEDDRSKFSYLLQAGLGLHKAGAMDQAIEVLTPQLGWLLPKIQSQQFMKINTSNVISATEILFNADKFKDRKSAINVIAWAVYDRFSGASLHEAIIQGAETAARMGDATSSKKFLEYFKNFEQYTKFQDRISALEAKLASATAAAVE